MEGRRGNEKRNEGGGGKERDGKLPEVSGLTPHHEHPTSHLFMDTICHRLGSGSIT